MTKYVLLKKGYLLITCKHETPMSALRVGVGGGGGGDVGPPLIFLYKIFDSIGSDDVNNRVKESAKKEIRESTRSI